MIFGVHDLLDWIRGPRARADRMRDLRRRLALQAGPGEVSSEELRVARELRRMREALSARFGRPEACRSCARGHPPPAGRWPGGHCCSGQTVVFTDEELAALKLSGTTARRLTPSREDHAGCVFRGPSGCVLRPSDRPNLCARYICSSLDLELERRGNRREIRRLSGELKKKFDAFVVLRNARLEQAEQRADWQAVRAHPRRSLRKAAIALLLRPFHRSRGQHGISPHAPIVPASDPRIAFMGRVERTTSGGPIRFGYPGVTLHVRFEGSSLGMRVGSTTGNNCFSVFVDGGSPRLLQLEKGTHDVDVAALLPHAIHSVQIVHRTETWQGVVSFYGLLLESKAKLLEPDPWPVRKLLLLGDSVTCGEGIDREMTPRKESITWNAHCSYGMRLARALNAQVHLVACGGRGLVRDWQGRADVLNAPQFFDLAVADDVHPAPWDHAQYAPDAIVISLGTNDFNLSLGAFPDRESFVEAYVSFLHQIRTRHPAAHIFLTDGAIVNDEAAPERRQKTTLLEYLAETVRRASDARVHLARSRYFPGDARDTHPTRAQHELMAADLVAVVANALGW